MRAFHLTGPSLDSLRRVDAPTPSPASGEVLIRLRAASLNYLDLMVARGQFPVPAYPFKPGCDGAGDIVALGDGVTGWAVGDRVAPGMMVDWASGPLTAATGKRLRGVTLPGSLAECVAVPTSALVRIPDQVSYLEAATLPIAGTTAWNAIIAGRVRPGSTVLLLGAGGVSLFALQFAKAAGARVIITSSSDAKLERARALGADETINHQRISNWDEAVLAMTGGGGVDLVVETVGAATFARSLNAVAIGGTIFVVGLLSGHEITLPVIPILLKTVTIRGNNTGSTADFADAMRALATNRIKPGSTGASPSTTPPPPIGSWKAAGISAKWRLISPSDQAASGRQRRFIAQTAGTAPRGPTRRRPGRPASRTAPASGRAPEGRCRIVLPVPRLDASP